MNRFIVQHEDGMGRVLQTEHSTRSEAEAQAQRLVDQVRAGTGGIFHLAVLQVLERIDVEADGAVIAYADPSDLPDYLRTSDVKVPTFQVGERFAMGQGWIEVVGVDGDELQIKLGNAVNGSTSPGKVNAVTLARLVRDATRVR